MKDIIVKGAREHTQQSKILGRSYAQFVRLYKYKK